MSNVLYFTAEWCNPCQRTRPIAEELNNEGVINFTFIDVDSEVDAVNKFDIKAVPTYILVKDGVEVKRMFGAKNRNDFMEFINE